MFRASPSVTVVLMVSFFTRNIRNLVVEVSRRGEVITL